jgi:hypothetical protein
LTFLRNSLLLLLLLLLLCGVHWSICKSSYPVSNMSYFNSPLLLLSFTTHPPFPEQSQQISLFRLLTCVYNIWTTSPHPFTLTPPLQQNLFHTLVLRFCRMKSMTFLLVWDKDIQIRRFLVLFPSIYVLQPKIIHLYHTSSLLPSRLPIVSSASLRFLYSFLYSGHINHIQVFAFISWLYPSHEVSP